MLFRSSPAEAILSLCLVSPDGMELYVCNASDITVTVIDIPSLTVSDTIANVVSAPIDLAFGP